MRRFKTATPKTTSNKPVTQPVQDRWTTPQVCCLNLGVIFIHKPIQPPVLQTMEQFFSEQREADLISQPLLDTENRFIKDLELYLDHRDKLALRKRGLLHKQWTECVWQPIQQSIKRRFTHASFKGAKPIRMMMTHYIDYCNTKGFVSLESYDSREYDPFLLRICKPNSYQVSTPSLKDPLCLQSRSRMRENRAIIRCQSGCVNDHQQKEEARVKNFLPRTIRSRGTVYLPTAEGRCFQRGCWSSVVSSLM
ncbi:protein FAM228B isoform X1 [Astyanax mexicanus]|uniref:Protein FAM228B isoform X1 n=1 Tax=Astyanax mexicanus TaxID=7994 RepID=A0A8T2MKL7_ASTMX|nr:protein FAM228B isoform X1 [Astyanax mexicanus]